MRLFAFVMLFVTLIAAPAFADDVTVGRIQESTDDRNYDFTMTYIIVSAKLGATPIRFEVDDYSFGVGKGFLNVGELKFSETDDIRASFAPGVAVVGRDFLAGGRALVELPKLKLTLEHRGYVGARAREHLTFLTWQPHPVMGLQAFGYGGTGRDAHWYLGPTLTGGPVTGYAGKRIGGPGWAIDVYASVKF